MTLLRSWLAVAALVLIVVVPPLAAQPTCLSDHQCGDGDYCNGIERCVAGTCEPASAPLACDDGDPCTTDSCVPVAGCAHADAACPSTCGPGDDGLRCSDGTACTVADTCNGGACVGTPLACDDADPCTSDTCDPTLGCTHAEQADPPACLTSSQCVMAADHTPCVGDGDPCTIDGCLEGACRVGLNLVQRQCADGNACNGGEFCSTIKGCEAAPALVCDDGDACNGTETCAPATGCVGGTPAADGTPCDDGLTCSQNDDCSAGVCVGAPLPCADGDPTTIDLCLEGSGCLSCAPFIKPRVNLSFQVGAKASRFKATGQFLAAAPFTPNGMDGTDVVLHTGNTVEHAWHVPGVGFANTHNGAVSSFVDRSGTIVPGIERLRFKTGSVGEKHQVAVTGRPTTGSLAHQPTRSLTVRAGSSCATAVLSCIATAGGTRDRCK